MENINSGKAYLNLISTNDLIDELSARFDSCIFYGIKDALKAGNSIEDDDRYLWQISGCLATCYGLCYMMIDKVKEDLDERYQHINKEDF